MPEDQARAALASLDKAIAHKPRKNDPDFAAATEHLCKLRDMLLAEVRQGKAASRVRLGQVNALISVVLAGHFPLGSVPWPEVERARGVLAGMASGEDGEVAGQIRTGR